MEDDGQETPRSPFWLQTTTNVRRAELYRRRIAALFFNSGVLVILLLLFAIVSMVFIIPSLISFTSNVFKPNLVKKSWDSINLVLVLFALAFGFLSRNINGDKKSSFDNDIDLSRASSSSPHQWYDFPEQPIGFGSGLRKHRSSSSYPDLRELSPPWDHRARDPWRFSDDTHLYSHRSLDADQYYLRRVPDPDTKDVDLPKLDSDAPTRFQDPGIDTIVLPETQPPVTTSFQDPVIDKTELPETTSFRDPVIDELVLPKTASFQDLGQQGGSGMRRRGKGERRRARSSEPRKMASPEPPSPPSNLLEFHESGKKSDRKKHGANATKEFFTSFYTKKKKKRQRHNSVDNLDVLLHHSQNTPVKFQMPPPPQHSVLNNLFTSKREKRKKLQSAPPAPPPPPPARPHTAAWAPKLKTARVPPFVTEKPRVPVKMNVFKGIDDSSSGGESSIPPPPPMPPFKMADWKFAVEGDYVRVQSGTPDGDEAHSPSSENGGAASPLFCPSPDVDTKADSFIARFRAGLKLEKINSFNQNQGLRLSNLGPGPGPSPP